MKPWVRWLILLLVLLFLALVFLDRTPLPDPRTGGAG